MKRRLIRIAMLGAGGLVLLVIAVFLVLWRRGSVQDWIGLQLQDISNSYLKPRLTFTDLSYQYPLTVSLKNLHLTADDPANPGHTIDIIACDAAVLSLAEIPSRGKPIVIEKIELDQPLITAEAVEPRSSQYVGFSDLLRSEPASTDNTESSTKLSDVFRMRLVQITDGRIVYNPRIPGTVPMSLDQINTTLNITPTDPGWYQIDTVITRKPVFEAHLAGQLNLDSFSVRDFDVKLLADLGQDKLDYLPPELQERLKQYEARGTLNAEITGSMPALDFTKGQVKASVQLDAANFTMGGMRLPVENLNLNAELSDGKATLNSLKINSLGGSADLSGSITLNDRLDSNLHLILAGMVLEKLSADPAISSASPARLDLDLKIATSLMSLTGKVPPIAGMPLASISLKDLRLSADDPTNAGKSIDVLACKNLRVAMTEPIVSGKPIVIDQIILDQPSIAAISVAPGSNEFVGLPHFPSAAPAAAADSSASFSKLSDLVRVKEFQLSGAKLIYDPRLAGTDPMRLDEVDASLNADPDNPGIYKLSTTIRREPVFDLVVDGQINLDHPGVRDFGLNLQADLTRNQFDFLPPQLQVLAKQTRAAGRLDLKVAATASLSDLKSGTGQLDLNVQNLQVNEGDVHVPVDGFSLSAALAKGKFTETARVAALNSVFQLSGSTVLNDQLDTDLTLQLKDVQIEKLLALLEPNRPPLSTATELNADLEIQTPLTAVIDSIPPAGGEPIATVDLRNLRLTADDPTNPGQPLDFLACDDFGVAISSLPQLGRPIQINKVVVTHPAIRAVALMPQSDEFAGFSALEAIVDSQLSSAPVAAKQNASTPKLSAEFQLGTLAVTDAALYYNPRIDETVPLSLDHIAAKVDSDSKTSDAYKFDLQVPSKPDLNLLVAGRINLDTFALDPLTADLLLVLGTNNPACLPPQLQVMLQPYDPAGSLSIKASGTAPLSDPLDANLHVDLKLDDGRITVSDYRLPIDHLRLPMQCQNRQVSFLDSAGLGGPTVEALNGTANVTGTVALNDRLDSTLTIGIDKMLVESLMADKTTQKKNDFAGELNANIKLTNAPLHTIIIHATSVPTSQPSTPATADLPDNWGSADIELTNARLAGLALIQDVKNFLKSAFTNPFGSGDKDDQPSVIPDETASLNCTFNNDRVTFSNMHYESEILGADGHGYVTLEQAVDLNLTGGPMAKLSGLGAVGNWLKNASDSLLNYHVTGTFSKLHYEVTSGNGKPISQSVKSVADKAGQAIGTGLDKAGSFFQGLFGKKSDDQNKN